MTVTRPQLIGALVLAAGIGVSAQPRSAGRLPGLRVSDNHRFLVTTDGAPFFWLGDTVWELFHRASREEAERYLRNRADRRFTVVQAVALAEMDGLHVPNAYGELPLKNDDPTQPNEAYFAHVDWIVARANALGLYVGFLPTWGDKWNKKWGVGPEIFTPANADAYGAWLGRRYRDAGLIWILGGDRPIESEAQRAILEAMAHGLRTGDGGAHLITFHPTGGSGSSQYFHDAAWLDVNMRQNGHAAEYTGRYDQTGQTTIACRPNRYSTESRFTKTIQSRSIRRSTGTRLLLTCAALCIGTCSAGPLVTRTAITPCGNSGRRDGTNQQPVDAVDRRCRPAGWCPDAARSRAARIATVSHARAGRHDCGRRAGADQHAGFGAVSFSGTRDADGSFAMVYAPVGRSFAVRMTAVTGPQVTAWWFSPRDGHATRIGTFPAPVSARSRRPESGELLDWVLVLDDARKNYPPPGAVQAADGVSSHARQPGLLRLRSRRILEACPACH